MRTPGSLLYRILFLVPMMLSLLLGITSCRTNTGNNSSTANNPLTILSIVGGNVLVQRSGSSDWSNGKQGITLEAGDKIKTDIGATATITFFDGSVIELNSSTEISLDELLVKSSTSPKTIKIGQTIGETLSRTVKLVDPASEYQITTPSAVAAVRGTTMQVAVAANGSTSVANVEGSVSVTAQGKEIIIPPGQHSLVESGQAPSPPQPGLISTLGVGGTIWTWGWNQSGQLGNGTTTESDAPVLVGGLSGVVAVSGGDYHGLALKSDGTVWAWGTNDSGQLGNGTTTKSLVPIQVSGLAGIISISAGYFHNLALKSDGTVWVWGDNSHGQLGNGTTTNSNMPIQLSGLTGVTAVSGGYYHSLALKSDGSVWAWGMNDHGQLGDGTTTERHVPVQISGLTGVTSISAGDWHSLALKADGTVWAWGSNGDGQLGNGTTVESHAPVPVSSLTGISVISAGGRNNLALGSNGIVWGWGLNDNGELGNGTTVGSHVPVQANVPSGIVAISIRDQHSLALRSDGSIWSWGWNGYGQVGDGTTSNSNLPIQLTGVNGVVAISAGVYYSLAINATPTNTSFNNPWVGVWVGTVTSTLGYYSGPLIATITSTGGNGLAFSYTTPSGLTGSYALIFTSNTMAASTNGAVVFTLNGNTITSVEADSGQTWTAARQ
jgi:alpha-tubulin suppressor-like RCC1 family protein